MTQTAIYRRHGNRVEGQCSGMTYQNNWPGNCTRAAVEDGLCRPHLTGKRRREEKQRERDERWAEQKRWWAAQKAQEAFVAAWRAEWPLQTYGDSWTCPLCNRVIQAEPYPPHERQSISDLADYHQRYHGKEWSSYLALAPADDAPDNYVGPPDGRPVLPVCRECDQSIHLDERMASNEDGDWHFDCANAPRGR